MLEPNDRSDVSYFSLKLFNSTKLSYCLTFKMLALADFTRTPEHKTYVEEGADVEFLWIIAGSSVINEVGFGIGSSTSPIITFLKVQPGNKVTVLPYIPKVFRGRVTFTGDLYTRTIRFQLSHAKLFDGDKFFGCNVFVTPQGSSAIQLQWKPTFLQVVGELFSERSFLRI